MFRFSRMVLASGVLALAGCGPGHGTQSDKPRPDDAPHSEQQPPAAQPDSGRPAPHDAALVFPAEQGVVSAHGAYTVLVQWLEGPTTEAASRCRLVFADGARHQPTSLADVSFKPWMTKMDHGGAVRHLKVESDPDNPTAVIVSGFYFTMGGAWDLLVGATVNGVADTAKIPVEVPK